MEETVISPTLSFVFGGVGAMLYVSYVAPFDRVKLLLQCHPEIMKSGRLSEPYRGIIDCTSRIYRTEGIRSFWRGNLIACIKYFPEQLINFTLKDFLARGMKTSRDDSTAVRFTKSVSAGALATFPPALMLYSLNFCRTRLAADVLHTGPDGNPARQFRGVYDVYRQTLRSDGIVGLHRGFMVSCLGLIVYRGMYLGLYDTFTPVLLNYEGPRILGSFALGFVSTLVAGIVSYPLDTIMRRMMMTSGEQTTYTGWIDCARYAIRNDGFLSLYNGLLVSLVKGFAGIPILVGYEGFKRYYILSRLHKD